MEVRRSYLKINAYGFYVAIINLSCPRSIAEVRQPGLVSWCSRDGSNTILVNKSMSGLYELDTAQFC